MVTVLAPIDLQAQQKWDAYTDAKEDLLTRTDGPETPWVLVKSDDKLRARLNAMRHLLDVFDYEGKDASTVTAPDPLIVAPAAIIYGA